MQCHYATRSWKVACVAALMLSAPLALLTGTEPELRPLPILKAPESARVVLQAPLSTTLQSVLLQEQTTIAQQTPPPGTEQAAPTEGAATLQQQETAEGQAPRIDIPFGESYQLIVPERIGRLQRALPTIENVVTITPVTLPDAREKGPAYLLLAGRRKATVDITLIGEHDSATYRFRWVASLQDLELILQTQFPNSSLKLTQPAENIIIVEGAIDSAADVQPILDLLANILPKDTGKVINAMQVIGPVQVQLEVLIARVDRTKLRRLGFNFTQSDGPWYSGSQVGELISPPTINTGTAGVGGVTETTRLFPFPGGSVGPTMTGNSTLFLGLTGNGSSFGAYLEALEQQNAIKVLARPVLVTMSGRPAEFLNGGEQPILTVAGINQNPNVVFKKFGTRLNFVPIVMGQGKIRLELAPSVSRVDETTATGLPGTFLPLFIEQSLHASVEMESGQTLVIGGMYQTSTEAVVSKVPLLGDLPLLGAAFRRVSHVQNEQELMVVVTPRLVHPLDAHQAPKRLPGDETRSPTNCELYKYGLPEVDSGGAPPCRPQGDEAPAPLQYHQWEPGAGGRTPGEVLPPPPPATESRASAMRHSPRPMAGTPKPLSPDYVTGQDRRSRPTTSTKALNAAVVPASWTAPLGPAANKPLTNRPLGR